MALIKQFRIKSYKKPNSIISFENVSLSNLFPRKRESKTTTS